MNRAKSLSSMVRKSIAFMRDCAFCGRVTARSLAWRRVRGQLKRDSLDRAVERKLPLAGVLAGRRRDGITPDLERFQPTASEADSIDLSLTGGLAVYEEPQRAA